MERPNWNSGDSVRSIVDLGKLLVAQTIGRLDNWLCEYGDEPIDTNDKSE